MIKITRFQNNKAVETFHQPKAENFKQSNEATLLDIIRKQGHGLEAPCSGQGLCGKCKVQVICGNDNLWSAEELSCLSKEERAAGWRLSCHFKPQDDIHFTWDGNVTWSAQEDGFAFLKSGEMPVQASPGVESSLEEVGMAVDIGTTTVVASLVSYSSGQILAEAYAINPQKQFGLDVMSRIFYQEQDPEGLVNLKTSITSCLNELAESVLAQSQKKTSQVKQVTLAGNTPMLHFLLGLPAANLGKAPYHSLVQGAVVTHTTALGIERIPDIPVYVLPPIKAFVGSDISAGLLASELESKQGNVLLIDIGTNGEIVLKTDQGLYCCSCAAGPAFEGANISCGMRASAGAVESIVLDHEGALQVETIGSQSPQGICGSGVLDAISVLAKHGLIGKTGRLKSSKDVPPAFAHLLQEDERGRYFLIDNTPPYVKLYQSDLRQIQLAKGAIRSGVEALLNHQKIAPETISEVLIAGQFGTHIKESSLIGSGMLPSVFQQKVTYIGNSAKRGAEICLLSEASKEGIVDLSRRTQYIELSLLEGYDRLFVNCLNFDENEVSQ